MSAKRPVGVSSRVRRLKGERRPWVAPNGTVVDLPVVVDIVHCGPNAGEVVWKVEATIDRLAGVPALTRMHLDASDALDPEALQQRFRWSTPLDIVTVTVPQLLSVGIDPFTYWYPVEGFPEAAAVERSAPTRLTDEFLTEIAHRYVALGRGYAKVIAQQRNVSVRTVVSWIEKARERGVLTATTPGAVGGQVRPSRRT